MSISLKASEAQTQRAILELLAAEGIFAFRLNSGAFVINDGRGQPRFLRANSLGAGVADIRADVRIQRVFYKGSPNELVVDCFVPLWLEVKSEDGRQSPEQHSFQDFVERQGHVYAIVRSVDDVLDVLWRIRH